MYYPYPEEFNRVTIDDISTLYFAPTDWSASNLLKENKNANNIFITGNTIVDSLQYTLNNTSPSKKIQMIIKKSKSLCINECKILLLTCHRRENYFQPIITLFLLLSDFDSGKNMVLLENIRGYQRYRGSAFPTSPIRDTGQ